MSALHDLTATQQRRALRRREVSSRELTEHYLERIDRHSSALGAFVTVRPDLALHAADTADALLARGEGGPLTGLPLGIKDMQPVAGMAMTAGSAALRGLVPTEESWTVRQLRASGAVFVGKTSTAELGSTCYTENYVTERPAVTPFDTARYSSGSSGGAATAVSAGLIPFAHGSDSAGSVRTPAATCNLVGLKPSRGLVSTAPGTAFVAAGSEGPLARTVEDAALLLDNMAAPWPGDLYGWASTQSFLEAATRPVSPMTIAVWGESGLAGSPTNPAILEAVQNTAEALRDAGHDVRETRIPAEIDAKVTEALRTWLTYSVAVSAELMIPPERFELLSELTRHLIAEGRKLSGADVVIAQSTLAQYASTMLAAFEHLDVALTPVTAAPPVRLGHFLEEGVESVLDRMLEWSCPTPWANLTGQPALSLPAGFTDGGLPVAVQLVGRIRDDARLLGLASQVEAAHGWAQTHPGVWHE